MNRRIFSGLIAFAACCAMTSGARAEKSYVDAQTDSLINNHKIVYIDGRPADASTQAYVDSIRGVISNFYYEQFRHFQDPAAPYFLFMSRDASLAMGIGGCVRMRGYYDWGGAIPGAGFAPALIPMAPDPTDMRHLGTTPAGSSLYFRVLGRNKTLGNYQLYIEANFNGYQGRDFHLKKAYATINDFTIGYAASTFSDPAAQPPTVDAQGPNNKISPTSVLIRYMPVVKQKWVFAVSAETPSTSVMPSGETSRRVSDWMPDFAGFVQYQWGPTSHVRLSGIVRTLSYRDLVAATNRNIAGWGVQLSAVGHPCRELTGYFTANYGHGIEGLGGDMQIGGFDLADVADASGRMYSPACFGWCAGLQYNIRPNLFVSAQCSQNRYLPDYVADRTAYKYGFFGALNVFWNLTPRIQVGAELDLGSRHNFDGSHRVAKRVGAMCQFSF